MPGIVIMAPLVVAIGAILAILALNNYSRRPGRYIWLFVAGLPLSFLINMLVKIPFLQWVARATGTPLAVNASAPIWFIVLVLFTSPVFEEAVKVLPLAVPRLRGLLQDPVDGLCAGLALGAGFGVGEAIYIAYGIFRAPMYSAIPWYLFTGYAFERLLVVFGHGLITAQTTRGMQRGGWQGLAGYLIAIGLHALLNLGALLVPIFPSIAQVAVLLSYAVVPALFAVFQRQLRAARRQVPAQAGMPEERVYFEKVT